MNRLYIIEGADGTGKSTLCNALMEATKGHLLHSTYQKDWFIMQYHNRIISAAVQLLEYQPVILDRWAVSEEVYANAFRGGADYKADDYMREALGYLDDVKFIYCSNENAIENHKQNSKLRNEMFSDMSNVVNEYERYMQNTEINWINYNFNRMNMIDFVESLMP